jgi:hypothetical protein
MVYRLFGAKLCLCGNQVCEAWIIWIVWATILCFCISYQVASSVTSPEYGVYSTSDSSAKRKLYNIVFDMTCLNTNTPFVRNKSHGNSKSK